MITASNIIESLLFLLLESRVVANPEEVDEYIDDFERKTNKPSVKQWLKVRLRKYFLNDYSNAMVITHPSKNLPTYALIALEKGQEVVAVMPTDTFCRKIDHVIDYFNSDDAPQGALHGISVDDAIKKSEEWNEILAKRAIDQETEEDYRVIKKDGLFTWVELLSQKALEKETHYMSHCVGDPQMGYADAIKQGRCQIISLRDSSNKPHVTIEVKGDEIEQVQGHGNKAVAPKYLPLCYDFINHTLKPKHADTSILVNLRGVWENGKLVRAGFADLIDMIDFDYTEDDDIEEIIEIGKEEQSLNELNSNGYGALHLLLLVPAVVAGSWIEPLLDAGCDPNTKDREGITPIVYAVDTVENWEDTFVFDVLLKAGADANAKDKTGDPVIFSVIRKVDDPEFREDIVDSLIRIGKADMNIQEHTQGLTPLMAAMLWTIRGGDEDNYDREESVPDYDTGTVSKILDYGKVDVKIKTKHGYDAMFYAVGFNDTDLMYGLYRAGADLSEKYPVSQTHLEKRSLIEGAIEDHNWRAARWLLRYKIDDEILFNCLDYCEKWGCDDEIHQEIKDRLGIEDDEEEDED